MCHNQISLSSYYAFVYPHKLRLTSQSSSYILSAKMAIFNFDLLLPNFHSVRYYFQYHQHTIVPATHFADTNRNPREYHNKVVIGRLLSITTPKDGSYFGQTTSVSAASASSSSQKGRHQTMHASSAVLLVFADLYNAPNCCALFLPRKLSFQTLFGKDTSLCNTVRIGDVFVIKDPMVSDEHLGESIVILKQPRIMAAVVNHGWPVTPMVTSSVANFQVYFDEPGRTIEILGAQVITGPETQLGCGGFTCDRQKVCLGCYGKSATRKTVVFRCDVSVLNAPHYSGGMAFFPGVCSLRLGRLFFRDLDAISFKNEQTIVSVYGDLMVAVNAIVAFVNDHGGWRVCGWHRQGMLTEKSSGESILNARTKGHITLLEPSNIALLEDPALADLQVATPVDDRVPEALVPRGAGAPGVEAAAAAAAAVPPGRGPDARGGPAGSLGAVAAAAAAAAVPPRRGGARA